MMFTLHQILIKVCSISACAHLAFLICLINYQMTKLQLSYLYGPSLRVNFLSLFYETFLVMKYHKGRSLWWNYVLIFLKVTLNFKDTFIWHIKWWMGSQGKKLLTTRTGRSREWYAGRCWLAYVLGSAIFVLYTAPDLSWDILPLLFWLDLLSLITIIITPQRHTHRPTWSREFLNSQLTLGWF